MYWIPYQCSVFFKYNFIIYYFLDEVFNSQWKFWCWSFKKPLQYYHLVNANNYFFKKLFLPDSTLKRCEEYQIESNNYRQKKNHNFLFHKNQQTGGAINQQLPVNILKRGLITYYPINFHQHKNFFMTSLMKKLLIDFLILSKSYLYLLVLVKN